MYNTVYTPMLFPKPIVFEWDKGNSHKNWKKHGITNEQAEEVFFDEKKKIAKDVFHSGTEKRWILLGTTKNGELLFIVFTVRNNIIRIVSARYTNKKEAYLYEKTA
jgi:uncharacterized protein